ncbi:MAG: outer membrane protein transport protein [Pseudomonadota bacterium]
MKKTIAVLAFSAGLISSQPSVAGGLWLNEFGDFSGGRASAGAPAGTDDAATIVHNPASATRLENNQLFGAAGALIPKVKFDTEYSSPRNGFDNGDDAGVLTPSGSMAYVHDVGSDKWAAGIYLAGAAGAGLDYGNKWSGRYQAEEVSLVLATLAPTIAYKLTDKLSIGASLQYWYANLELKVAVPRLNITRPDGRATIDGDDTGFGYTAGVMYELTDRTRFGVLYQSELEPDFDGDLKLQFPDGPPPAEDGIDVAANTELTLAEYVRLAMHHDMDENWSVYLTVGWDNWSRLNNVLLSTERGSVGIPTQWRDTYHYAWGTQYRLDDKWTVTTGFAYDTNPVNARNRNAQLPVDRQIRLAVGARYDLRETLSIGGYVNYAGLGKARIEAEDFGGKYDTNRMWQLIAMFNWTF